MAIENTLSIIKPDATKRNITGSINAKFEDSGLNIIAQKRLQLTKGMAKKFYDYLYSTRKSLAFLESVEEVVAPEKQMIRKQQERKEEYEPAYRAILCDLSTKPKSFYLDGLLNDDGNEKLTADVNRRINRAIPEKIHVIFLSGLLIPTLIAKSMEDHHSKCMGLKGSLEGKLGRIDDVIGRIGPSESVPDSILNLLYYKTYDTNIRIIAAPDWKQLKEYGGNLTIEEFRKSSITVSSFPRHVM